MRRGYRVAQDTGSAHLLGNSENVSVVSLRPRVIKLDQMANLYVWKNTDFVIGFDCILW